jgi:hypothetical protein
MVGGDSMDEEYRCIICGKTLGIKGSIAMIGEIAVSLCAGHADMCDEDCENCDQKAICPAGSDSQPL